MFDLWNELVPRVTEQVEACPCSNGCPACIGAQDAELNLKEEVIKLLHFIAGEKSMSYEKKLMQMKALVKKNIRKRRTKKESV